MFYMFLRSMLFIGQRHSYRFTLIHANEQTFSFPRRLTREWNEITLESVATRNLLPLPISVEPPPPLLLLLLFLVFLTPFGPPAYNPKLPQILWLYAENTTLRHMVSETYGVEVSCCVICYCKPLAVNAFYCNLLGWGSFIAVSFQYVRVPPQIPQGWVSSVAVSSFSGGWLISAAVSFKRVGAVYRSLPPDTLLSDSGVGNSSVERASDS